MVLRSTLDFAVRRSWLLLPTAAAGAGAGYAIDGLSPVMAGGAAIGLAPALAAGLVLEMRGQKLHTARDVERRVDLETLGSIGRFRQAPGSAFPADEHPDALQAYRALAESLRARGGRELRTVLVTSAGPEEGKSTTAANLATVLAQMGSKVVLVDADLRWSSLRSTIANASSLGLSGLLMNYLHSPQLAIVRTNEPNLYLLPAGVLPPKPQELLALPRLGDLIASLREKADYVVFDSPPVLEAEDARLLAINVDATLMVMHAGKTRSREVNRALRLLMESDAKPLGAVLNQVRYPEPAVAPAAEPKPTAQPAAAPMQPAYVEPKFEPFSVDAFRKATPKPVSANLPRPRRPEPESLAMRLAREGFGSERSTLDSPLAPSAADSLPESLVLNRRLDAVRNLRIVTPDERPLVPVVTDWETRPAPVLPASEEPVAPVAPSPAPSLATAGMAAAVEAIEPVSVDDVLAHMEETLRLIREMRREKSPANS